MASKPWTVEDDSVSVAVDEYESISLAVVMGVSELLDIEPCSLPPISLTIDTDALDALYTKSDLDASDGIGPRITFEYSGQEIVIDNSFVLINPIHSDSRNPNSAENI